MATASTNLSLIIPEATDATVVRTVYNTNWELIDDIFDTVTLTEFGYLDGVTSAIQTQLNAKQTLDAGLTSIAGLTTAADKMIYTTALDAYAVASLTAFARTILDDADASTVRTTLGLVIGTNVQAYDASLSSIAALTYASASFIKLTAEDTYAVRTISEVKSDLSLNLVENTALSTWVGTTNITTLGTIATGVWSGTVIGAAKGGTGVANNAASTLTISGNFATTLTVTEATGVTLPASGTLATTAQLHTQNTDTDLDATFEATFVKKADTVNVLSDITSAGADIEDAVTKKHTQNTDTLLSIATALSSDHTYLGITDSKNVGENVVFGDLLYFDWTQTEWMKAKADVYATARCRRIALESKANGEACLMLVKGYIRDDSAFNFTTAIVFLSITTAGATQSTVPSVAGNQVQIVGTAISADIMEFNPSMDVGEI